MVLWDPRPADLRGRQVADRLIAVVPSDHQVVRLQLFHGNLAPWREDPCPRGEARNAHRDHLRVGHLGWRNAKKCNGFAAGEGEHGIAGPVVGDGDVLHLDRIAFRGAQAGF